MKDVLLISNYWHFEVEKSSSRYISVAHIIADHDMDVEVVTSSFYHATKSQRKIEKVYLDHLDYKVKLIEEKGYRNNISIKRILSHKNFAKNVFNYLKERKKPDVIYLFMPPLDLANVVAKFAKKNNIKLIIDILDLWPEAYKMVMNIPIISDIVFAPMKYKANEAYAAADEIIGVSDTYVARAMEVNKKCSKGHSIFLGTQIECFKKCNQETIDDEIQIAYIGSLGYSYDLTYIMDALKILNDRGIDNIRFLVMGDGPLRNKFQSYAKEKNVNVEFLGVLKYEEMAKILVKCHIAVNPIKAGSAGSIINKVGDYAAAGLPVINTQESREYSKLVEEYNIGFNCPNNNAELVADKIMLLYKDKELRNKMGKNNRKLAEEKFDRTHTYKKIIELIDKDLAI